MIIAYEQRFSRHENLNHSRDLFGLGQETGSRAPDSAQVLASLFKLRVSSVKPFKSTIWLNKSHPIQYGNPHTWTTTLHHPVGQEKS